MNESTRQTGEFEAAPLNLDCFFTEGTGPDEPRNDSGTAFLLRAAHETWAEGVHPVINPVDITQLNSAIMLGIVSYCYARNICASTDIEEHLRGNPAVRAACGDQFPSAHSITRFRRLNREAILATLERFYRLMRTEAPKVIRPPTETGNTQVIVRRQAEDQLQRATFIDGMSREY